MDLISDIDDFIDISNETDECPICYEKLENYVKLKCNHNFCLKCYSNFIKNKIKKCSMCRIEIKEIQQTITIFQDYRESNELLLTTNNNYINSYKMLKIKYKLLLFIFYICFFIYFYHIGEYHTIKKKDNINEEQNNILNISYLYD